MPMPNAKNVALGSAATQLGLGGTLSEDLENEEEKRRKLREGKRSLPSLYGDSVLGNAAMDLMSPLGYGPK